MPSSMTVCRSQICCGLNTCKRLLPVGIAIKRYSIFKTTCQSCDVTAVKTLRGKWRTQRACLERLVTPSATVQWYTDSRATDSSTLESKRNASKIDVQSYVWISICSALTLSDLSVILRRSWNAKIALLHTPRTSDTYKSTPTDVG